MPRTHSAYAWTRPGQNTITFITRALSLTPEAGYLTGGYLKVVWTEF